jgi:hypothetical protein
LQPSTTQRDKTTTNPVGNVQKKDESGRGGGMNDQLRGTDFAAGEKMLSPVQMKGGKEGDPSADNKKATEDKKVVDDKEQVSDAEKEAGMQKAAQDLGVADDMPGANRAVGGFIDAMSAVPGTGFSGSIEIKIPLGVGMFMGLKFEGSVKRSKTKGAKREAQFKARISFNFGVKKTFFELYAGVFGEVGIKAVGDSGAEIMSLMGLLIRNRVEGASKKAANKIWGDRAAQEERVLADMEIGEDGKSTDSAEAYGKVGVQAGVKIKKPDLKGGKSKDLGEVKGDASYKAKDVIKAEEKDGKKKLKIDEGKKSLSFAVEASAGLGLIKGKLKGEGDMPVAKDAGKGWDLKLGLEIESYDPKIKDEAEIASFLAVAYGTLFDGIQKAIRGKDKEAELAIIQHAATLPTAALAGRMVGKGLAKAGVGTEIVFKEGKYKSMSVYEYKKVAFDADYVKGEAKHTTTLIEEEAKKKSYASGGDKGGEGEKKEHKETA